MMKRKMKQRDEHAKKSPKNLTKFVWYGNESLLAFT